MIVNELELEEVLNLEPVDFLRPVPAERVEGLDDGEAGGLDAPGDGALVAQGRLALDELLQVAEMGDGVFRGGGGQGLAMLPEEGQAQGVEAGVEEVQVGMVRQGWSGWS